MEDTNTDLRKWNNFEISWLFIFISIGTIITVTSGDNLFNYFVLVTGILCVVLAAKGHSWTYVFGLFNSVAYSYTAYKNGLFGEVGLNLLFYVPMNFAGFFMWQKNTTESGLIMKAISKKSLILVLSGSVISIIILGNLLSMIKGQNTPFVDASTNIIGITATFLMVYRFKEQWLFYIALNVLTITMWAIRYFNDSSDGLIMVLMWGAFLVNSVYGYINWSKNVGKIEEI